MSLKIQSMTGFSRIENSDEKCTYTIELKSVNGRFLDLRFKIPSQLNQIEHKLKLLAQKYIKRGNVEVNICIKKNLEQANNILDDKKIEVFLKYMGEIAKRSHIPMQLNPTDFLRSEFMLDKNENNENEIHQKVQELFEIALEKLVFSRSEEGVKLQRVFNLNVVKFRMHVKEIEKEKDNYKKELEDRLLKRFQDLKGALPVDGPRFMQEIIYYMEKMDIDEELDRIGSHLEKLDKVLEEGGEVGRQLDFILQELGRETNTIGSKTFQNKTSESIVQMKVVLEKIREQGLNVE